MQPQCGIIKNLPTESAEIYNLTSINPHQRSTMEPEKASKKTALFQELFKFSKNSEYDRALKACNRILHEFPDEPTAFEAKLVCLINLLKFQEALELLSKNPKLAGNFWFEKSYCMYRLNRMSEAKDILESVKDQSIKKKELLAQILYRMEIFEECYDIYREVIKNTSDSYEDERQTNFGAIVSSLFATGSQKKGLQIVKGDTFESMYNTGCQLAAMGQIKEADQMLEKAEKTCIEFLREDGVPDDEIDEEIAAIKVQRGYCAQKLGREKEAQQIYNHVLKIKPSDVAVIAIASNNILSLNRDQNIFDSKKRIKMLNSEGLSSKLQNNQQKEILFNQCLFYLQTNQADNCKEMLETISSQFPDCSDDALLLSLLQTVKKGGFEAAKKTAKSLINKHPQMSTKLTLCLAQNLLQDGKCQEAIQVLRSLAKEKYQPGVVSALVTLYHSDGEMKEALKILKESVDHFKKSGVNKEIMTILWRQSASLMVEEGEHLEAVESLEELLRISPNDFVTLAQLIVAYSQYDISKAQKLSSQLPDNQKAVENVDMSTLESPHWLSSAKLLKKAIKGDSTPVSPKTPTDSPAGAAAQPVAEVKAKKKNRKKKKKKRLPANYDPNVEPDPERWLPRYQRGGYRPKKVRKGRVDVGKGTQGTAHESQSAYDMTSRIRKDEAESLRQIASAPGGSVSSGTTTWKKPQPKKKKRR